VVRYVDLSVEIEITDDGRGAPHPTDGFGLHGMRQRVHLLGGEISAANRREGGFAVRAVLPVSQEALAHGAGR
jgi:signal transduction histidine kinase